MENKYVLEKEIGKGLVMLAKSEVKSRIMCKFHPNNYFFSQALKNQGESD